MSRLKAEIKKFINEVNTPLSVEALTKKSKITNLESRVSRACLELYGDGLISDTQISGRYARR